MSTEYLPSDRNAAAYAGSPMALFCVEAPIVVASTVGNCTLFGPPVLGQNNDVITAGNLVGALRSGHRLAIWRLSGGTGAGGTMTAAIFTFNTTRDTTTPVIIARATRVVDLTTVGGWSLFSGEMITPFAPTIHPLAVAEPGYGVQIRVAAAGSDGTIVAQALCSIVPTKVPKV